MKVLYDHQIFTWQKYGGISRYFTQIITHLPKEVSSEVSVLYSDNEYLKETNLVNNIQKIYQPIDLFYPNIKIPFKRKLFRHIKKRFPYSYPDALTLNKHYSIEMLKKQDFDVFHPTYYDDYFLEYIGNKPFVLTIHDMIHEIYPELLNDPLVSIQKAKLASKASHIIAISEQTKGDIVNILGIEERKITVVYHANSILSTENIRIELPSKYFLFIGDRQIYKNFIFCIRALSHFMNVDDELKLICIGRNFTSNEIMYFESLNISNQVISMSVDDESLSQLYKNALALIFPSYYEGFGIPILEAFSNLCPVLLSSSSCFPEIAGDAALYFDPKDLNSIIDTISKITNNSELRLRQIEKGLIVSKRFSWDISANKTKDIYSASISN